MYEAYFKLKERPFSISPDPRFFYLTAQHREALTNCQYMITNRVGPVYVHGDVGTGKTTIARRLYQQFLDDPQYIPAMIISPNLKSSNALLRLIMKEFDVKTDKKYENSLTLFGTFLQDSAAKGKVPVLFIDEAQLLKPDMLELVRFLLNFETNTQKLLQIVLFGQNELIGKIEKSPELKDRITIFGALSSLSKEDIDALIDFRWRVAGGQGCSMLKALIGKDAVKVEGVVIEDFTDIMNAIEAQQVEGEATQQGKDPGVATDATGILAEGDIAHVV